MINEVWLWSADADGAAEFMTVMTAEQAGGTENNIAPNDVNVRQKIPKKGKRRTI